VIVLGVAFLTDASACVLVDGEVVSAISEERLNRVKQWHGVPHMAILEAMRIAGVTMADVDVIATHGACPPTPDAGAFARVEARVRASELPEAMKIDRIDRLKRRHELEKYVFSTRTPAYVEELRQYGKPLQVVGHHEAHASAAYFGSGWDSCHVLTMDGWGEDGSATRWRGDAGTLRLTSTTPPVDSMGYFYGSVTHALGFIPERHEGKVLGLAAYCQQPKSYEPIRAMVDYDPVDKRFAGHVEGGLYFPGFDNPPLTEFVQQFSREDVASAAQRTLEDVVVQCVRDLDPSERRVALAGGVFANVKVNQRVRECANVDEVYVFPNMGDGGLSVGAAWLVYSRGTGRRPAPFMTACLGPDYPTGEVEAALREAGVPYERPANISKEVARLLASDQVVVRFDGRMEFGPRALGRRSILCHATDSSVNQWLNERLQRSEFMPFAPVTLVEDADRFYRGLSKARTAARYMTMTFDCTPEMLRESPAAVHVDHTARPQTVSASEDPDLHAILSEYKNLTGRSTIINTSFNMHEEPIVCTVDDAIRAFHASGLPYMAVGDVLVKGPGAHP